MIRCLFLFLIFSIPPVYAQKVVSIKTIHVYVALCDNLNQGIVPVPKSLGNGQNPSTNLYWGALYGVKTHFKNSADWKLLKAIDIDTPHILERLLFKHKKTNTYLLADAYDGKYIKETTIDFLKASGGDDVQVIPCKDRSINFGGASDLVAYVGHDGLMEFTLDDEFTSCEKNKDAIILACISKNYFSPYVKQAKANPLIWSTGLMSPEAYTLKAAIDGWIINETDEQIQMRAARAYHQYQNCGVNAAKKLLVTGF